MADINWPDGVPYKILRDDFQGAEPNLPPQQTDMQGGNTRMRPATTVTITTIQGAIYMTDAQFEIFRRWHRDTLIQGTREFNMPVFGSSSYSTKQVQLVGGTYKWVRYGKGWKISLALRIWDW